MTLKTLRDQLLSNPHFVVSYIVGNNPGAVEDRLRAMGFTISTEDDIFETLNELLRDGRTEEFREALTVPILTDGRDAAELAVLADVAKANMQATSPDGQMPMAKSIQGPWSQGPMGATSEADDGSSSTSFWNTQAASGLLSGLFNLGAGFMTSQGLYQTPTNNVAPPPAKKSNTMWVVVLVGVVLIGTVWYFLKKSK